MTEFATNNNKLAFTKLFLLLATKSIHFHISFNMVKLPNVSTYKHIFKKKTLDISRNI